MRDEDSPAGPGPWRPTLPGRGLYNRIAPTAAEQLTRAARSQPADAVDLARRDVRRALALLRHADRRLAGAGRGGERP